MVTKFFIAREKNRKQRKSINCMEINGSICENPTLIGEHVYNSYNFFKIKQTLIEKGMCNDS